MKELLEIFNAKELSVEVRIAIIEKMVAVLDFQVGANIYQRIADELCKTLNETYKGGEE
jgi:hypothetical protein